MTESYQMLYEESRREITSLRQSLAAAEKERIGFQGHLAGYDEALRGLLVAIAERENLDAEVTAAEKFLAEDQSDAMQGYYKSFAKVMDERDEARNALLSSRAAAINEAINIAGSCAIYGHTVSISTVNAIIEKLKAILLPEQTTASQSSAATTEPK